MAPRAFEGAAAAVLLLVLCLRTIDAAGQQGVGCNGPRRGDRIIGHSQLYGQPNASDAIWADQTSYFQRHGPITNVMMLRAYFYDGEWHDPGEFKGLQLWYGNDSYNASNPDQLLFGARKPHLQLNCTLAPGEAIIRAEVQHDRLHRFMAFTLNTGRVCAWGFPNARNTTTFVATAPDPGAYLAAVRGFEGKPLPPERGGYKKRYIVQVSWVWAQSDCADLTNRTPLAPGNAARKAATTEGWAARLSRMSAVLTGRQGQLSGAPAKPSAGQAVVNTRPAVVNTRPAAAAVNGRPAGATAASKNTPQAVTAATRNIAPGDQAQVSSAGKRAAPVVAALLGLVPLAAEARGGALLAGCAAALLGALLL